MNIFDIRRGRSATALGLFLATPAMAQAVPASQSAALSGETPSDNARSKLDDTTAQEIIVTARRMEERLQDVPISISVLNQQQISDRNIVTASDLASYVPSLSANNRFGSDSSSFALRGFTQEIGTASSVGVYFADVVAPRAAGGTTAGNGAGVGSFFDLQNVQVLKGPQGTLFGRNTTGGAILLVPQKPTRRLEGYIEGSVGSYSMRRVQAVLNVPLSDSVRFRVGVDRQLRDGYLVNKSGVGPKDFGDVNYWAIRASLVADLTPDLENYTIGSYNKSDTNGFYPKIVVCNPTATAGAARILAPLGCGQIARQSARGDGYYDVDNGNSLASQHSRQWQVINTTTWQASDTLTLKNIVSYAEFRQDQTASIFGDNFSLAPGVPLQFASLYKGANGDNASQWTFSEELQLQGRSLDGALTWQVGGYFEKSGPIGFSTSLAPILASCPNVYANQCSDPIGAAFHSTVGTVQDSMNQNRFRNLGFYAQASYSLTSQLSVTGGIRYTSDQIDSLGEVRRVVFVTPNNPFYTCAAFPTVIANDPSVCAVNVRAKSSRPTWLVDLDYKPNDNILLYAKYSRGYRAGGTNTSNPGLFERWGPEKVDAYEVGAKTNVDGALHATFNIAAFFNDFSNQQLQANAVVIPPQTPASGIVNAGKSRIKGVEIDASITPFRGFTLDANYAYLSTRLESFTPPAVDPTKVSALLPTAIVGGPLTLSPKNRISLTGNYTLPLGEAERLSLGATFTHTDSQLASAGSPISTLPATDLLNLNLNWNSIAGHPLDFSIFATNVTNQKYPTYITGSFASAGFDAVILGQPRMYGARLRYRF